MNWYEVAHFMGGVFLSNSLPHLVNEVSGRSFQSPFAKPPGKGLSSPLVNVLWGFFNLAVAYVLILHVGTFNLHDPWHATVVGAGILIMSINHALIFGRFHSAE